MALLSEPNIFYVFFVLLSLFCLVILLFTSHVKGKVEGIEENLSLQRDSGGFSDADLDSIAELLGPVIRRLNEKVGELEERVSDLEAKIGNEKSDSDFPASALRKRFRGVSSLEPAVEGSRQKHSTVQGSKKPARSQGSSFMELYNEALRNREAKRKFEAEFEPIGLSVLNTEERMKDPETPPLFEKKSGGDYWMVERENGYLALPRAGVVLEDAHRSSGAMDWVFQCEEYPRGIPYEVAHLEQPAELRSDGTSKWSLGQQGRIYLERYG